MQRFVRRPVRQMKIWRTFNLGYAYSRKVAEMKHFHAFSLP